MTRLRVLEARHRVRILVQTPIRTAAMIPRMRATKQTTTQRLRSRRSRTRHRRRQRIPRVHRHHRHFLNRDPRMPSPHHPLSKSPSQGGIWVRSLANHRRRSGQVSRVVIKKRLMTSRDAMAMVMRKGPLKGTVETGRWRRR